MNEHQPCHNTNTFSNMPRPNHKITKQKNSPSPHFRHSDISLQEFLDNTTNLVAVNVERCRRIRGNWNPITINRLHRNLIDQVHWCVDMMVMRRESHVSVNGSA